MVVHREPCYWVPVFRSFVCPVCERVMGRLGSTIPDTDFPWSRCGDRKVKIPTRTLTGIGTHIFVPPESTVRPPFNWKPYRGGGHSLRGLGSGETQYAGSLSRVTKQSTRRKRGVIIFGCKGFHTQRYTIMCLFVYFLKMSVFKPFVFGRTKNVLKSPGKYTIIHKLCGSPFTSNIIKCSSK